jgi:biopolymer transport protein ExbD
MRKKRHRQLLEVNASINVTNLLDTAFILLITFMLVAPRLSQHGLKVDLPQVEAASTDVDQSKVFTVVIQKAEAAGEKDKVCLVDRRKEEHRLDLSDPKGKEEFIAQIQRENAADPKKFAVVIEADTDSRSGVFVEVIGAIQKAGVTNIGISTKPENPSKPSSPSN